MRDPLQDVLPPVINHEGLGVVALLQEAVDKLDAQQHQTRGELFSVLQRSLPPSDAAPAVTASAAHQPALDAALAALCSSSVLLPGTYESTLAEHGQEYRELSNQMQQLLVQLQHQRAAADIQAQVGEFQRHMHDGQYSEAAWCAVRLQRIAEDDAAVGPEQELVSEEDKDAVRQLRSEAHVSCQEELTQAFDALMHAALRVETGQRRAYAQPQPEPAAGGQRCQLFEVLAAMEVAGVRNQYLQQLAARVSSEIVCPLLSGPPCHVELTPPAAPGDPASLSWQPMSAGGIASSGKDTAAQACRQVLKLLGQHLLGLETEALTAFGALFWRQLSDDYLRLTVAPALAAHAEDVEACERVVAAAQDLEAYAEGLGFFEEPYLGPAVEMAARTALSGRTEGYLLEARRLMMPSDHAIHTDAAVSVGRDVAVDTEYLQRLLTGKLQKWESEDPPCGCSTSGAPTAMGRYQVQRGFAALVILVEKALGDAVMSGNRAVARALRSAVCSMALMARTLPAATGSTGWLAVPQLALLHYNGLRHLADALLLLPVCYNSALEPLLDEPLSFLDEALSLRQAARQLLMAQVKSQQQVLGELLDGLERFKYISASVSATSPAGHARRKTVRQVHHSLSRLGVVLVEVLRPEDALDVACQVAAAVADRLVQDILSKRDIGIDDSKEMAEVLQPLADDALQLLLGQAPATHTPAPAPQAQAALSGIPLQQLLDLALARCQALRKLRTVLRILQAKMSQIVMQWQRRRLQSDGLDGGEVQHLILALFQDSDKRREALAVIAKG